MPSFSVGFGLVQYYKTIKPKKPKASRRKRGGLGGVEWSAPSQTATLFVGLNKGKKPVNAAGMCPAEFSPDQAEKIFVRERAKQVGRDRVAGTLGLNRGYFKGAGEQSFAIQIVNEGEDFRKFKKKALELADAIGKAMCQDEVIVVSDDAKVKEAAGVAWEKKPKRRKR